MHELELGARAQDAQAESGRFSAVALHWLLGLVYLARGDEARAREEFTRELAFEPAGHLYARECCANTWYAIGAMLWRQGRREPRWRRFAEALSRVPAHVMALAGLVAAEPAASMRSTARAAQLEGHGMAVEAAMGRAASTRCSARSCGRPRQDRRGAAPRCPRQRRLDAADRAAAAGQAHPAHWRGVLARLAPARPTKPVDRDSDPDPDP